MPLPMKRLMTRPLTLTVLPVMTRPLAPAPAADPFSSTSSTALLPTPSELTAAPGCVYPSMLTGSVTPGSGDCGVMVRTPVPGMLKVMSSGPGFAFASRMAWRSEPAPALFVFVTTKPAK